MPKLFLSIIPLVCLIGVSHSFGLSQSTRVTGRLFCGAEPAANVKVLLEDKDTGPDPDDELDSKYTDATGRFTLSGNTMELTTIDPVLKIFHDCNDHDRPCQRQWKITIPDKYVTRSTTPSKTFNLGEVNLEMELEDENRDCIH